MRGVPAGFRDDGAMSARPPRTPPRAVGGSTDPQSAFVADVEAVQRAAVAYRRHAEEMGRHGPALHVLGLQVLDAAAASGTRRARPADAWSLWRVARRLSAHAEARGDLARRAQTAVALYRDVDSSTAAAFDRLLAEGRLDPGTPPPWVLERSGVCSSPGPGEESYRLPTCPGYEWSLPVGAEDLMRPQHLEIAAVRTLPATARPGLAGAMQAVHDAYAAPGSDGTGEADTIDVRRHIHHDAQGRRHESYLVALPGTSSWDLLTVRPRPEEPRSLRPNLEGVQGKPSAEALLLPEALERAGVPPGASVLLVGHSQGGMTAMSAAALTAMRRYRVAVLTAGAPVGRMPEVPGVPYLHVVNPGDVVPLADGAPNRRSRDQVTVTTGKPVTRPLDDHDIARYVEELDRLDRAGDDVPPALAEKVQELRAAGHLQGEAPGDVVETTRVWVRHR